MRHCWPIHIHYFKCTKYIHVCLCVIFLCYRGVHIYDVLEEILKYKTKRDCIDCLSYLTQEVHVWPDYHGNRSPLADSTLKGMVCSAFFSKMLKNTSKTCILAIPWNKIVGCYGGHLGFLI
jgi:hypothetical protein